MRWALIGGTPTLPVASTEAAVCGDCKFPVYPNLKRQDGVQFWAHYPTAPGQPERACATGGLMTRWHYDWQNRRVPVSPLTVEVWRDGRRADVLNRSGAAVEFQHSRLSPIEAQERERHWGRGCWVFDGTSEDDTAPRLTPLSAGGTRLDWQGLPRMAQTCRWPTWVDLGTRGMFEVDMTDGPTRAVGVVWPTEVFVVGILNGDAVEMRPSDPARPTREPALLPVEPPDHVTNPRHCSVCGNRLLLIRPGRDRCARHD